MTRGALVTICLAGGIALGSLGYAGYRGDIRLGDADSVEPVEAAPASSAGEDVAEVAPGEATSVEPELFFNGSQDNLVRSQGLGSEGKQVRGSTHLMVPDMPPVFFCNACAYRGGFTGPLHSVSQSNRPYYGNPDLQQPINGLHQRTAGGGHIFQYQRLPPRNPDEISIRQLAMGF